MRAATTTRYGAPDVLHLVDVPPPEPRDDEVLIEVRATTVTAGDDRLRAARFPSFSAVIGRLMIGIRRPRRAVQGTMFAGRVAAVGRAVTRYAVGDDVFGAAMHGAYAEYLAMPEDGALARMPAGIDYGAAAATPYGGVTALRFLRDAGEVKPGDKVLILGAAGGVGRFAISIGKALGAEVTALCRADSHALVRRLGADHVLDRDADWSRERYDVIFDCADATSFAHAREALRERGRYLSLYLSVSLLVTMLITAFVGGKRARLIVAMGTREDMEQLARWLAVGVIRPVVGERFSLERIAAAHAALRGEASVIITPASRQAIEGC